MKTSTTPLRITFILPFANLTGGIKIIYEHANRLVAKGHHVNLIYPGILFHGEPFSISNQSLWWRVVESPLRRFKYWFFVQLLHKTDADWFPLDRRIILKRVPDLSARFVPDADIVVAVSPDTAEWVNAYPSNKGIKVFFSQDYDVWAWPAAMVDRTYSYPMHLITIGGWQKKLYEETFHHTVEAVIPDGVDTTRFNVKSKQSHVRGKPWRILMVYHHLAYKGLSDGFAAIKILESKGFSVQIVMFGVHDLLPDVPEGVEYHQAAEEDELPAIYRSCDLFLWPTHREGFGLPPMEALACGLPVVATETGAVPDYLENGKVGYIVPIKRPELLASRMIKILSDQQLYREMSQAAADSMKAWDWDRQTDKLERYFQKLHQSYDKP